MSMFADVAYDNVRKHCEERRDAVIKLLEKEKDHEKRCVLEGRLYELNHVIKYSHS